VTVGYKVKLLHNITAILSAVVMWFCILDSCVSDGIFWFVKHVLKFSQHNYKGRFSTCYGAWVGW